METKKLVSLVIFCFVFISSLSIGSISFAGEGGGKEEAALNIVIDTKYLSGINLWVVNLYNNNRILYAIVVTLVMATLGSVLAFGTDLVLKYFGMNVSRISHHE